MTGKLVALAGLALAMAGCTASEGRLDSLRGLAPAASVQVAAGYREASSCLIDQELRRSYQVIPNLRDVEHRATLTGYYNVGAGRHQQQQLYFEYEVTETGAGTSRISIKRASYIRWSEAADARLAQDMATCRIALRG
ncbi:MAG TPA: hypothetical protein VGM87_20195 [Roseomonas sp.]|jgi:hypothetical protein